MTGTEKNYTMGEELKKSLIEFLKNPFDNYQDLTNLVESKDTFTETEINKIVTLLGKFPAYSVYPLIDSFRGNLKEEKIGE
jgi:hypothetical protein